MEEEKNEDQEDKDKEINASLTCCCSCLPSAPPASLPSLPESPSFSSSVVTASLLIAFPSSFSSTSSSPELGTGAALTSAPMWLFMAG